MSLRISVVKKYALFFFVFSFEFLFFRFSVGIMGLQYLWQKRRNETIVGAPELWNSGHFAFSKSML